MAHDLWILQILWDYKLHINSDYISSMEKKNKNITLLMFGVSDRDIKFKTWINAINFHLENCRDTKHVTVSNFPIAIIAQAFITVYVSF